jgi:ArsR family transcriptional regulator
VKELPTIQTNTCCGLGTTTIDEAQAARIAPMFKALGDPVRLRLAALIASQAEICVCELTPHFQLSGPTISHHLKTLREAGLIDGERRGTWVYYWIKPDALHTLSALLQPIPAGPGEAVNEFARAGLARGQRANRFQQRTANVGLRIDVTNIADVLE